jgi:hypothetical protein
MQKFIELARQITEKSFHGRVPGHSEMVGVLTAALNIFVPDDAPDEVRQQFAASLCAAFDVCRNSEWKN